LLAMVVNDNAGRLNHRSALGFIASKLAPTGATLQTKIPGSWSQGFFCF
jgi:hypothetical protein